MAQEGDTETAIEVGALDEAGNVGDGEAGAGFDGDFFLGEAEIRGGGVADIRFYDWAARVFVQHHGADVGLQGSEGPVPHAGAAIAEGAEEGALASVGEADEPDVGEEFELELDGERDGLLTLRSEERTRVLARDKVRVPQAADTSRSEEDGLRGWSAKVKLDRARGLGEEALAAREAREDDVARFALRKARVEDPFVPVWVVRVLEFPPLFLGQSFLAAFFEDLSPLHLSLSVPDARKHSFFCDRIIAADFPDDGADGDGDDDILAFLPRLRITSPVLAPAGPYKPSSGDFVEGCLSAHGLDVDITSVASIAAIGGAVGEVRLAEEGDAPAAAGASIDG